MNDKITPLTYQPILGAVKSVGNQWTYAVLEDGKLTWPKSRFPTYEQAEKRLRELYPNVDKIRYEQLLLIRQGLAI